VERSTLLVAVGAALGGVAVMMGMLAVVYQPVLLFVALPFAGVGYLMWYQGTGRLAARTRRRAERERARQRARRRAGATGDPAGGDDGPRWADAGFRDRHRSRDGPRGPFRGGARSRAGGTGSRRPPGTPDGMSVEEAYRTLEIPPDSAADEVRDAYRDKVKDVHPDTEDGDQESFKEVNEAYETLRERGP
jgi:hypothetical protein